MKYRAEIDGLRAVAVIPVILFHAEFELFSGGFVGVDVFFVISGYLITSILIEDIENNRFSISNFYERRARRILPALFFVMIVCVPFAWMLMLPNQFKDFSQSIVAASLFASNILFWRESGYFDSAAEEKPLLHTWSLAVEEQFYVLFPILLVVFWPLGKKRVFYLIAIMTTVSLLLSEYGSRNFSSANFYLAPSRVWELFSGSIAAFIVQKRGVRKNNFLALLGLTGIIVAVFVYDESTPFPSSYAVLPVLGVVLLVLYAEKTTYAARMLSAKVLVWVGLISYSAYLWHQPLFAFARIHQGGETGKSEMLLLSGLSLFLAYFSYRFIENYYRNKQKMSARAISVFSAMGLTFFASIGLFGHIKASSINSGLFNPYHALLDLQIGDYIADNKMLQEESWEILRKKAGDDDYGVSNNAYDGKLWFDLSRKTNNVLIVGNSHSKDLFNVLHYSEEFQSTNQIARFGEQVRNLDRSHQFWSSPNYKVASHILIATRYNTKDLSVLPSIVRKVRDDGKDIFIVKNIFEFPGEASGYNLIDKVILENRSLSSDDLSIKVNQVYYDYFNAGNHNYSTDINEEIAEIARELKVPLLNRMDYICDNSAEVCFAVDAKLSKNFYDYGHHTLNGSSYFAQHSMFSRFLRPLTEGIPPN